MMSPKKQKLRLGWERVTIALLGLTALAIAQDTSRQPFLKLFTAAQHAREQGQDREAIELYRRALYLRPDSQESLWYLGTTLYERNEFTPARDIFRVFLTLRPDAGAGWAFLGLCEFQLRDYSRALDHLHRAMASGMGDNEDLKQSVFYSVAILLTRFERYDDSMSILFGIANNKPCDDSLVQAEGLAGLRVALLPSEIPNHRRELIRVAGQGMCAVQQGRSNDALGFFATMKSSYGKEPGVHFLYGSFLMSTRVDEGIEEMKRELEIAPSNVAARNRLAEQYTKLGQVDQALDLAREAEKLEPNSLSVRMTLGEALIAKGNSAEGVGELERAQDLDPDNTRVRWDLAQAYIAMGRGEDARREKQKIEDINLQNNAIDKNHE